MKDRSKFVDLIIFTLGFVVGVVLMVLVMDATGFFNLA